MRLAVLAPSAALVLSLSACGREALLPGMGPSAGGGRGSGGPDAGASDSGPGKPTPSCTFEGFADPVAYTPSASPYGLITTDLTGDGRLDLLIVESHGNVPFLELLTNLGNGTFSQSALPVAFKPSFGSLVAADFNGDGLRDLANQSNSADGIDLATDDGVLALDFGTGHGTLASQPVTLPTPQTTGRLAVGDVDDDGRPDLVFAGYDYVMSGGGGPRPGGGIALPAPEPANFALNVYRNTGNGGNAGNAGNALFAAPVSYPSPSWSSDLVTGDFDGDGHLDIAELASTTAYQFGVFFNAGHGTFHEAASIGPAPDWGGFGLGVADFDGDGIDDLATPTILRPNASDEAIVIEVYKGAPDRTFAITTTQITAVPDVYQVATGNFDGDGKPDIALVLQPVGRGGGSPPVPVAIFANRGDGTFAAPVIHSLIGANELLTNALTSGDFNGDGITDLAVATTGRFSPYPVAVHVLLSRCE